MMDLDRRALRLRNVRGGDLHALAQPDKAAFPTPRRDDACHGLAFGVAKSQNAIIARLAHDHITPDILDGLARKFGFGRPLDFDLPVLASTFEAPRRDPLGYRWPRPARPRMSGAGHGN